MADITAPMVKELRETTGVGMMDAKKALVENDGNMESAVDWLRTQGLAKAAKKSGRTAAEGLVGIATEGAKGAVVEVNAETDFVSRNEEFQSFVGKVAQVAKSVETIEALAAADLDGKPVSEQITNLIATIGENMALRRMTKLSVSQGAVVGYVHSALAEGLGKLACSLHLNRLRLMMCFRIWVRKLPCMLQRQIPNSWTRTVFLKMFLSVNALF